MYFPWAPIYKSTDTRPLILQRAGTGAVFAINLGCLQGDSGMQHVNITLLPGQVRPINTMWYNLPDIKPLESLALGHITATYISLFREDTQP